MRKTICMTLVLLLLSVFSAYGAEDVAGSLRMVKGKAVVERDGRELDAYEGFKVMQKDVLKTGRDGSMGIIFKDDTRMSLGPDSRLVISNYVFKPAEGKHSMLAKINKGTATYSSGRMEKLSPQSVSLETPTSTIGIRGTSVLIKVAEAQEVQAIK